MRTPRRKYFLRDDLSESSSVVGLFSEADSMSTFSHRVPIYLGVVGYKTKCLKGHEPLGSLFEGVL